MDRSQLRAGDADRKQIVRELEQHYVDGRLTTDEYDERVGKALTARTFGKLDGLLHDLPPSGAPLEAAQPAPAEAEPHPDAGPSRRGFREHLLSYLLVMALLVAIYLLTSPGGYFWPIWPMLGWGIGIAAHGLGLAGRSERRAARRARRQR